MENEASDWERLGGEVGLRSLIDVFIDRVASDLMIGYLFKKIDLARLKELEFAFAAGHLGAPGIEYPGRPLERAHAHHRILGGQFNRRLVLLEKTLRERGVPEDIIVRWVDHNQSLRSRVTGDEGDECVGKVLS